VEEVLAYYYSFPLEVVEEEVLFLNLLTFQEVEEVSFLL
jgi:hypothetical protein